MLDTIRAQPKVELHRHLEGTIRLETLAELAKISISSARAQFQVTQPMGSLAEVIAAFMKTQKLLETYEILERIAFEACEDAYIKENIQLLELRYAPSFINIGRNLNFDRIHTAICQGIEKAKKLYPIQVGLIGILVRSQPLAEAEASLNFFLDHKDTFIGIDLADQEVGFDLKIFKELFYRAKKEGLRITCHSGEEKVMPAEAVRDAVEILGAERIGHGIQAYKSQEVMKFLKDKNILLEICPTSNWITGNINSIEEHPVLIFEEVGVPYSINTDDPGVFGIDLNHEWLVCMEKFNWDLNQLISLQKLAKKHSFIR